MAVGCLVTARDMISRAVLRLYECLRSPTPWARAIWLQQGHELDNQDKPFSRLAGLNLDTVIVPPTSEPRGCSLTGKAMRIGFLGCCTASIPASGIPSRLITTGRRWAPYDIPRNVNRKCHYLSTQSFSGTAKFGETVGRNTLSSQRVAAYTICLVPRAIQPSHSLQPSCHGT